MGNKLNRKIIIIFTTVFLLIILLILHHNPLHTKEFFIQEDKNSENIIEKNYINHNNAMLTENKNLCEKITSEYLKKKCLDSFDYDGNLIEENIVLISRAPPELNQPNINE